VCDRMYVVNNDASFFFFLATFKEIICVYVSTN
jgi:hypothetical protein